MTEEWRDVPGWEGHYQVSDEGNVRSLDRILVMRNGAARRHRGRVLSAAADDTGRARVNLCMAGESSMKLVHRLVAEAFIGPCPVGMEACHNNGNASDNRRSNIRWDTHVENVADTERHGNNHRRNRTHCPRNHELADWNCTESAKRRGRRGCLACGRASAYFRVTDPRFDELSDQEYYRLRGME